MAPANASTLRVVMPLPRAHHRAPSPQSDAQSSQPACPRAPQPPQAAPSAPRQSVRRQAGGRFLDGRGLGAEGLDAWRRFLWRDLRRAAGWSRLRLRTRHPAFGSRRASGCCSGCSQVAPSLGPAASSNSGPAYAQARINALVRHR